MNMGRYFSKPLKISGEDTVSVIKQWSYPLPGPSALDPLIKNIGDAGIVMLGEASHGTSDFYLWRWHITRRLIEEKGFNFMAVEGDWPDCYRLNRFIKNDPKAGKDAYAVLNAFNRWPTWMWANWELVAFAGWLHHFNKEKPSNRKVGFYGLDVYSLHESLQEILAYLHKTDPSAYEVALEAARCFEPYRKNEGLAYARAAELVPELCQTEVVSLLTEIRARITSYNTDPENVFSVAQNSTVVANAEQYYREMIRGGAHSWNLRDRHMHDTLVKLLDFHGSEAKAVIWAHNTHIGDASATDMIQEGMYNIGELARLHLWDKGVYLVGFGSYQGTVTAGHRWGGEMKIMDLPPGRRGSWEDYLHKASPEDKLLLMEDFKDDILMEHHLPHRAVGVVYQPEYEQYGNYVPSILPLRYDAFIHIDESRALHPLHIKPSGGQVPETYPFGV